MNLNDLYILLTGGFIATACALLGSFLILRKMAMVGDAISHAVLPGIVLAFLVSGSRASLPVLIGASALGLFTTFAIELFHKKAKLQEDASIGVTFTWLFAIGVILVTTFTGKIDLDIDCVLHGELAYIPLDLVFMDGFSVGPRAMWISLFLVLAVATFVGFGYKGLKISSFNPQFAISLGISAGLWHYLLMGMVSLTTVLSFDAVGAILVVAFLVVPPATAFLLTGDLKKMLLLSVLFGWLSTFVGYYLAKSMDGSVAGGMATVSGVFFFLVFAGTQIRKKRVVS